MCVYLYIYIYTYIRTHKLAVFAEELVEAGVPVQAVTQNQERCRCSKDILLLTTAAYAVLPNTAQWLQQRYGIRTLHVEVFLDLS